MLDLGWTEILVIGVVALIVIGPRDLPMALHTFGKYVGKLRSMARDFQQGIDDIARQQELKEVQEGINKFRSPEEAIENYVKGLEDKGAKPATGDGSDPDAEIANMVEEEHRKIQDWDAASNEIASPAAKSVAEDQASILEEAPETPVEAAEPVQVSDEPELPLGTAESETPRKDQTASS